MLDMENSAKINRFSKSKKPFPKKTDRNSYVFLINSKATVYQIISAKLKTSSYRTVYSEMVTFAFDKWPVRENKLCEKLVFPGVFLKVNFFVFLLVQQVE